MPLEAKAHPPFCFNATVALSGTFYCYPEWHDLHVYEREKCCTNLTEQNIAFRICMELVGEVWIQSSSFRTSFCLVLALLHSTLLPFLWSLKTKRVWAFRECLFCDTFDLCISWLLAICFIRVGWSKISSKRCDTFMKNARTMKMCVLCVCFDVFFKDLAVQQGKKADECKKKFISFWISISAPLLNYVWHYLPMPFCSSKI